MAIGRYIAPIVTAAVLALGAWSCSSKASKEAAAPLVKKKAACDSTSSLRLADAPLVTYDDAIKGILTKNCTSCHGGTAKTKPLLDTWDRVKTAQDDIAVSVSAATMPQGKTMTKADKKAIADWKKGGFLRNEAAAPAAAGDSEDDTDTSAKTATKDTKADSAKKPAASSSDSTDECAAEDDEADETEEEPAKSKTVAKTPAKKSTTTKNSATSDEDAESEDGAAEE